MTPRRAPTGARLCRACLHDPTPEAPGLPELHRTALRGRCIVTLDDDVVTAHATDVAASTVDPALWRLPAFDFDTRPTAPAWVEVYDIADGRRYVCPGCQADAVTVVRFGVVRVRPPARQ